MNGEIALLILQYGLKYGPAIAEKIRQMFVKQTFTEEEFTAVWMTLNEPGEDFFKKV